MLLCSYVSIVMLDAPGQLSVHLRTRLMPVCRYRPGCVPDVYVLLDIAYSPPYPGASSEMNKSQIALPVCCDSLLVGLSLQLFPLPRRLF